LGNKPRNEDKYVEKEEDLQREDPLKKSCKPMIYMTGQNRGVSKGCDVKHWRDERSWSEFNRIKMKQVL
jgi:hypothetical protein